MYHYGSDRTFASAGKQKNWDIVFFSSVIKQYKCFLAKQLRQYQMGKKNRKTKSFIWTAEVLTVGHENFCKDWESNSLCQITDSAGNTSFVRYIPARDPDMTIYEDVNQMLLNGNQGSQNAKRKLEVLQPASQASGKEVQICEQEQYEVNDDAIDQQQAMTVLDPEDVSKTISEIQEQNFEEEPNCSAIVSSQVNKSKNYAPKLPFFCATLIFFINKLFFAGTKHICHEL